MKDNNGNALSQFSTLGVRGKEERESNDFYATPSLATEYLVRLETLDDNIWECACGQGHISKILERRGHNVLSTDLIDRGYGKGGIDFLECTEKFNGDIVTNPPFKYAHEFVKKAIELIPAGNKVCMFLKIQFLEGKERRKLFCSTPPGASLGVFEQNSLWKRR